MHRMPRALRLPVGPSVLELCAGAGGQALGLEQAGFRHVALIEIDKHCCATLRVNRPEWNVVEGDIHSIDSSLYPGVDLVAAGLPCPPFSVAGKQLGKSDERNLFPVTLRLISEIRPRAVLIENVRGFLDPVFKDYRAYIVSELGSIGYSVEWRLLNTCDFEVSQLRPRVVLVAISNEISGGFFWPEPALRKPATVGELLLDLMAANGWRGAEAWSARANDIAPTIVGGSLKHGGPDLGPTRARRAWADLGVDGLGIADEAPTKTFRGDPKLTVRMVARLQGFDDSWKFVGGKTAAYRQVGNAFPPPVARAVAQQLRFALMSPRGIYSALTAS